MTLHAVIDVSWNRFTLETQWANSSVKITSMQGDWCFPSILVDCAILCSLYAYMRSFWCVPYIRYITLQLTPSGTTTRSRHVCYNGTFFITAYEKKPFTNLYMTWAFIYQLVFILHTQHVVSLTGTDRQKGIKWPYGKVQHVNRIVELSISNMCVSLLIGQQSWSFVLTPINPYTRDPLVDLVV